MANKEFLEKYPLYKKFKTNWEFYPEYGHTQLKENMVPKPAIHMYCNVCDSEQTFNMSNEFFENRMNQGESIIGKVKDVRYVCSACEKGLYVFLIYFGYDNKGKDVKTNIYLEKVGQIPAWSIKMDKELEDILEDHAEDYKKGLICESQGYGIGSFAYFRRITEEIIDGLLDSISDLLEGDGKEKYKIALAETKKTRVTQEKIELVKDLLPVSLCPDGMNPLGVLHSALSEGLHAETDQDCLEYADSIKEILIYLANKLKRDKKDSKRFTDSMKKLLNKKSEKVIKKQ
ncbi:MAG: hypothetical protein NTU76_03815 [Candidatus Taylorbacteria bacterium]|nr:hypothetical protein [Candidatus Taylorbacteria bacterium]